MQGGDTLEAWTRSPAPGAGGSSCAASELSDALSTAMSLTLPGTQVQSTLSLVSTAQALLPLPGHSPASSRLAAPSSQSVPLTAARGIGENVTRTWSSPHLLASPITAPSPAPSLFCLLSLQGLCTHWSLFWNLPLPAVSFNYILILPQTHPSSRVRVGTWDMAEPELEPQPPFRLLSAQGPVISNATGSPCHTG